jgi:hypothetical protein
MKNHNLLSESEIETTYELVEEFFGSMKADQVYFSITHPQY